MKINELNPNLKTLLTKLLEIDLDFLIIGGLICKASLEEHGRETNDVDIVFDDDLKKAEEVFRKTFDVVCFDIYSFSKLSTEESFASIVKINNENILIEGRRFDIFKSIKKQTYKIDDLTFKGVPIEFQIAEKIISMFSIPVPSYKHLIDLYSFSLLDESKVNKEKVKYYFDLLLSYKNEVKNKLNLPLIKVSNSISVNTEFDGPIYLTTLQANHNCSKECAITRVNEWLKTINI